MTSTRFNLNLLSLIRKGINFDEVKLIVETENLLQVKGSQNSTLLHYAAKNGNTKVAQYLIDSGIDVDDQNTLGETALMLAFTNKHVSVAEVLVSAGASVYIRNNRDESVLATILERDFLTKENRRLCLKILQNDCLHHQKSIANKLFEAAWPLYTIVELRHAEVTKIMLQEGYTTNVDQAGAYRQTALHVAVKNSDVENVKVLLAYGANMNALDYWKRTPLSYVYDERKDDEELKNEDDDNVPNHSQKRLVILKLLLEHTGKKTVVINQLYNILKYGNKEAIKLLIESKIDPMSSTTFSRKHKALHMLACNKNPNVMENLRDRSFNINVPDECNETPLMIAAKVKNISSLEFLLKHGANVTDSDKLGRTALFYAIEIESKKDKSAKECVQILLEYGANVYHWTIGFASIFDVIFKDSSFELGEIVFAHLALKEAKGENVIRHIQSKLDSHAQFKNDFESSKQQLAMKVHKSTTLLDLLTGTDETLERYVRNEELAEKLKSLNIFYYFNTILQRRLAKAEEILTLKRAAARAVCQIMKSSYDRFPLIADNIISYLDLSGMENLIAALAENQNGK